mmetsp:Transcript_17428/g.20249  ORF Transcript_17428/g.20249 Transcript_17428/m.20249 type:complete len:379 (-) Transcript_17428:365-1501(-)
MSRLLAFIVVLCWYTTLVQGEITLSFVPRAFSANGDVLGANVIWYEAGFVTNAFKSEATNGYYVQGKDIIYSRSTITPGTSSFTNDTIVYTNPQLLRGTLGFRWETFKVGTLWDTSVETGYGQVEFQMSNYSYDVQFTQDSSSKFIAIAKNFVCNFTVVNDPTYNGTVQEVTKQAFPMLKGPLLANLNANYCPKILNYIQLTLTNFLKASQTSQSLDWVYGGFSTRKTLNLSPINKDPFKDGKFVIISTGGITQIQQAPAKEKKFLLVSDEELHDQQSDICIVMTNSMINSLIKLNSDFFGQYKIVLTEKSGNQKYYPFNLWQFWEATLYDLTLYEKIGKEIGKFKQTDPITLNCNYTGGASPKITSEGKIQFVGSYK